MGPLVTAHAAMTLPAPLSSGDAATTLVLENDGFWVPHPHKGWPQDLSILPY